MLDASPVTAQLWMGGAVRTPARLPFDLLVLCAAELQPNATRDRDSYGPRARVVRCPLWDTIPTPREVKRAIDAATDVRHALDWGKRVLVTCAQGRNRSGLVLGLALVMMGLAPRSVVQRIRTARGPHALSNPWFVHVLGSVVGRPLLRFPRSA